MDGSSSVSRTVEHARLSKYSPADLGLRSHKRKKKDGARSTGMKVKKEKMKG